MKTENNPIAIPQSERGSNYSVAGETWCENFRRAEFAKKYALALARSTGSVQSVEREIDKKVWRTNLRRWHTA